MKRLRVDWPECSGRGFCAEAAPDLISLDEWGYPIVLAEVAPEQREQAKAATRVCPRLALRLVASPTTG